MRLGGNASIGALVDAMWVGRPALLDRRATRLYGRTLRFNAVVESGRFRELPVSSVFPGVEDMTMPFGVIHEDSGNPNQAEFVYLLAAFRALRPSTVLELGTNLGQTTYFLAQALPDAIIYTVDLPDDRLSAEFVPLVGAWYRDTPEAARITAIRADSRTLDVPELRGQINAVWVDGDHSYEAVKDDTARAFEMLAPGGAIFWHDFTPKSPGVVDYLVELSSELPLFRIRGTSIVFHRDGVDPLTFEPLVRQADVIPRR